MTTPKDFTFSSHCCERFYESECLVLRKYDESKEIWAIHWEGVEFDDSVGPYEEINYCPFCGSKIR